ncbi:cation:dicarboxylase symporter family transporter [Candidatus Dependentiae bacterium]|nr:cation:dicarboxylase symporter family transporter [Candidatus Dependentiae bacterium]
MLKKLNWKIIFTLPFQLITVIFFVIFFGKYFGQDTIRTIYTFSFLFKEILGLFLPVMVFAFILGGFLSYKKRAPIVLFILLAFIIISNFLVSTASFFVGKSFLSFLTEGVNTSNLISGKVLLPWFSINIPPFVGADKVILLALGLGVLFSFVNFPIFNRFIFKLKKLVEFILLKCFIPFLPLYVLGFLLKMSFEGTLSSLFGSFGKAFLLIFSFQAIYLFLMYFVSSGFKLRKTFEYIKNTLPSYVTAFSTMSSAVTIPVTAHAATKNTKNSKLSYLATPILANAHLVGDAITVPILSLVTIYMFTFVQLDFFIFIKFVLYFCLTMLAAAGIPGGGIIVIIPILQSILGFDAAMISVMTTLYLLQDAFGTACNVMGDGALTIILDKFLKKIGLREKKEE